MVVANVVGLDTNAKTHNLVTTRIKLFPHSTLVQIISCPISNTEMVQIKDIKTQNKTTGKKGRNMEFIKHL